MLKSDVHNNILKWSHLHLQTKKSGQIVISLISFLLLYKQKGQRWSSAADLCGLIWLTTSGRLMSNRPSEPERRLYLHCDCFNPVSWRHQLAYISVGYITLPPPSHPTPLRWFTSLLKHHLNICLCVCVCALTAHPETAALSNLSHPTETKVPLV